MDDAVIVRGRQGVRDLAGDIEDLVERQRPPTAGP